MREREPPHQTLQNTGVTSEETETSSSHARVKYSDDFSWEKIPFQQIKIVLEVLVKFHLVREGQPLH